LPDLDTERPEEVMGGELTTEPLEGTKDEYLRNLQNTLGATPSSLEKVREFIKSNPNIIGKHIKESVAAERATRSRGTEMDIKPRHSKLLKSMTGSGGEPLLVDKAGTVTGDVGFEPEEGIQGEEGFPEEDTGFLDTSMDAGGRAPKEQIPLKPGSLRPDQGIGSQEALRRGPLEKLPVSPLVSKPNPLIQRAFPAVDPTSMRERLGLSKQSADKKLREAMSKIHVRQYSSTKPVAVKTKPLGPAPKEEKAPTETKGPPEKTTGTGQFLKKHKIPRERLNQVRNALAKQQRERYYAKSDEE